jgi:hypothetical protein
MGERVLVAVNVHLREDLPRVVRYVDADAERCQGSGGTQVVGVLESVPEEMALVAQDQVAATGGKTRLYLGYGWLPQMKSHPLHAALFRADSSTRPHRDCEPATTNGTIDQVSPISAPVLMTSDGYVFIVPDADAKARPDRKSLLPLNVGDRLEVVGTICGSRRLHARLIRRLD